MKIRKGQVSLVSMIPVDTYLGCMLTAGAVKGNAFLHVKEVKVS